MEPPVTPVPKPIPSHRVTGGPLRVLIAEDHAVVRSGIRLLLERKGGIQVVAEAADGREAVALTARHRPDVVLMDIAMPQMSGLDAAAQIHGAQPDVRIIMLSMFSEEEFAARALRVGAHGYLATSATSEELLEAVRVVARGERFICRGLRRAVLGGQLTRLGAGDPVSRLTPRQREVFQLIVEGTPTGKIAERLRISVKTVETHRTQIMKRCGARNVPELVRLAIRHGLLSTD